MLYENENKLTRATHVSMNEPRRYDVGRESQTQNNIHHEFPFINLETYPTNTFEQCLLGWWRQKEEPGSDHKEGGGSGGEGHVAAACPFLMWAGRTWEHPWHSPKLCICAPECVRGLPGASSCSRISSIVFPQPCPTWINEVPLLFSSLLCSQNKSDKIYVSLFCILL